MTRFRTGRLNNGGRVGVALAFVALSVLPFSGTRSSAQDDGSGLIELNGTGSGEIADLITAWAGPLFDSSASTSLGYLPKGDRDGRLAFTRGENDFVVTGRPFTDADKANLAERKTGVIEAPIAVGAMAFLLSPPFGGPLMTDSVDPAFDPADPDAPRVTAEYKGPVRLPSDILGRIMLERENNSWTEPAFAATIAPLVLKPPPRGLEPVVRSDPGAMNFYLETFVNAVAKPQYNAKLQEDANLPPDIISENWPFLRTPSRTGDDTVGGVIGSWASAATGSVPAGGAVAAVSPSQARHQFDLQPGKAATGERMTPLYVAELQNAAGEWVAPTPDSISKAAEAGGSTPLFAMTNPVSGAYPLTWISTIGMPSSGLSPQKTTALATMVRYAVTAGQAATAPLGEGHLPASMVAQALDAANQVVAGNCKGSDRKVATVSDGGPAWPKGVAAPASATVCVAVATDAPTTTTTFLGPANTQDALVASPTTVALIFAPPSGSSSGSSGSGSGGSGLLPSSGLDTSGGLPDVSVESATDTATTAPPPTESTTTAPPINASSVAASLPLPLPSDGRFGLDRLVTAMLGGLAFLGVRNLLRKRPVMAAA